MEYDDLNLSKKRKIFESIDIPIQLEGGFERGLPRIPDVFFYLQKKFCDPSIITEQGLKKKYLESQYEQYICKKNPRKTVKWNKQELNEFYEEIENNGFGNFQAYSENTLLKKFNHNEFKKKLMSLIGFSKPSSYYQEAFFKFTKAELEEEKKILINFGEENQQNPTKKGKLLRDNYGVVDKFINERITELKKKKNFIENKKTIQKKK